MKSLTAVSPYLLPMEESTYSHVRSDIASVHRNTTFLSTAYVSGVKHFTHVNLTNMIGSLHERLIEIIMNNINIYICD